MQNARRKKKFGLSFYFLLKEPLLDFNWKVKVGSTSRFFDFVWIGFKSFSTFEPLMRAMTVRTAKIKKKFVCVWERKRVCVCVRAWKTGSKSVGEKGRERERAREWEWERKVIRFNCHSRFDWRCFQHVSKNSGKKPLLQKFNFLSQLFSSSSSIWSALGRDVWRYAK